MRAVPVAATLRVAIASTGVDAGVVLEEDVRGPRRDLVVPVLEGILGVPDHVVAIRHAVLVHGRVARLVGERRVVDLPQAAALHEHVLARAPELDAVAEAHGVEAPAGLLVRLPELESTADPVDVAVADHDVARGPAAETVRPRVAHGKPVVHHIVATALVDDVPVERDLDRPVGLARIAVEAQIDAVRRVIVPVVVGLSLIHI